MLSACTEVLAWGALAVVIGWTVHVEQTTNTCHIPAANTWKWAAPTLSTVAVSTGVFSVVRCVWGGCICLATPTFRRVVGFGLAVACCVLFAAYAQSLPECANLPRGDRLALATVSGGIAVGFVAIGCLEPQPPGAEP